MAQSISEKTTVSYIVMLGLIGLAFWTGQLYSTVSTNSNDVKDLKKQWVESKKNYNAFTKSLAKDIGRLEEKVERIHEIIKK